MRKKTDLYLGSGRPSEHDDGWPDAEGWNGQHRDDHPVGPGESGVHAQDDAILVGNAFEYFVDACGGQVELLLLRLLIRHFPLGRDVEALK